MPSQEREIFSTRLHTAVEQVRKVLGTITIDDRDTDKQSVFSHLTLLLIEQEGPPADVVKGVFASLGVKTCIHARNIREAMQAKYYNLVIAGDALAEREVLEIATWVRNESKQSAKRQVVALRSQVSEHFARRATAFGIDDVITKPTSVASFLARISYVLLKTNGYVRTQTYKGPNRRLSGPKRVQNDRRKKH